MASPSSHGPFFRPAFTTLSDNEGNEDVEGEYHVEEGAVQHAPPRCVAQASSTMRVGVLEWVAYSLHGPRDFVNDVKSGLGPRDVMPRFVIKVDSSDGESESED